MLGQDNKKYIPKANMHMIIIKEKSPEKTPVVKMIFLEDFLLLLPPEELEELEFDEEESSSSLLVDSGSFKEPKKQP